MNEELTDAVLSDFESVTKYDISQFFADYMSFVEEEYTNIINYYGGASDIVPKDSLAALDYLIKEQRKAIEIIILNSSALDNYAYWIVTEKVEDIGSALETANNASKWMRSNLTRNGYRNSVAVELVMSQGQGLEQVERDNLRSNDPDGWFNTALENQLREEDYDLNGGKLIKVIFKNNAALVLNSVIDNIDSKEKTYGKDIDKRIVFENDDLVTLSYNDTMLQSAKILADLKRGDDPAFPDRGLNFKGGTLAGISYPTIFRQLAENFATDDSFKSFSIIDVVRDRDAILLKFEVETRTGEVFENLIPLDNG